MTTPPWATPKGRALAVLAAAGVLAVFGGGGWMLTTAVFGGDYGRVRNVVAVPPLPTATSTTAAEVASAPILLSDAQVVSAVRAPDNRADARLAMDADPSTSWSTDFYRAPFGNSVNGIGVLVSFDRPVDLSSVWVATAHPGATIEIRTAPRDTEDADETTVLGAGVLGGGATDIVVDAPDDLRAVLVWVAELAPSGGQFVSDFEEIGFTGR